MGSEFWQLYQWIIFESVFLLCVLSVFAGIIMRFVFGKKFGLKISLVALFISAVVGFYPQVAQGEEVEFFGIIITIAKSITKAIELFVVSGDFEVANISSTSMGDFINTFNEVYMTILYVVFPLLTFSAVLFVFKSVFEEIKFVFSSKREVYIFSELNESSLLLGADLKANNRRRCAIYCDVYRNNEEQNSEMIQQARSIGAICIKRDIVAHGLRFGKYSQVNFFMLGASDEENISQALYIIDKYGERENTCLYLLSESKESEILIAGASCTKLKIRRINEKNAIINRHLYNNGIQLFTSARQVRDEKIISVIIVGLNRFGMQMYKTLLWYCQMYGYKLKILGIDSSIDAESKLKKDCPDIFNKKYNGKSINGEAYYEAEVKGGLSEDGEQFVQAIKERDDATYIFVDLGSDAKNAEVSAYLRTLTLQMGIKPIIETIILSAKTYRHLSAKRKIGDKEYGVCNFKKQTYDVSYVGNVEQVYTEEVIINGELERAGLDRHMTYVPKPKCLDKPFDQCSPQEIEEINAYMEAINDFYRYEYNYNSSIASAMHIKARQQCNMPGANTKREFRNAQERELLNRIEHCRWNAYMRSIGYVWSGSYDKSSRNDLALMHHNLVAFDKLPDSDKDKDDV